MKNSASFFGTPVIALVVLAALVALPVSGIVSPLPTTFSVAATGTEPGTAGATTMMATKQTVSATVSSEVPVIGELVTISGTVIGNTVPADVQIWVFAGNYVNVTTVPVTAAGTFSRTYASTGMPPATYYVYIQSPGANGIYNIDLEEAGVYSGQVVNTLTNTLIFNFSGSGSVQDAAASNALSDAINNLGIDDAYTKLTFQLVAPGGFQPMAGQTTAAITETSAVVSADATTAKSPFAMEITGLALMIGGLGAAMYRKKRG
jgi:hypothetical protein